MARPAKRSTSFSNGVYSISGGGPGFGSTTDKLQFGTNGLVGNWISPRKSPAPTPEPRRRDVPQRQFATPCSPRGARAGQYFAFRMADATGGSSQSVAGPTVSGPVWVKLTRAGNDFQGWYSGDGSHGRSRHDSNDRHARDHFGGLAVTSNNNSILSSATFANVSATRSIAFAGTGADIGGPDRNGTSAFTTGDSYIISGSGTRSAASPINSIFLQ